MLISFVSVLFSFSLQFVSSKHVISICKSSLRLRMACFCLIMTVLKVCSLNVRGLGEQLKRREIFNWLRVKKILNLSTPGNS